MIYLLDVNALVALGFLQHQFHVRVANWAMANSEDQLATCSITELGFVRILAQAPQYGFTVSQARDLLIRVKASSRFTFIPDTQDISDLPAWVRTSKHITDGHLAQLAKAHNAILATLDQKIPGTFLIP